MLINELLQREKRRITVNEVSLLDILETGSFFIDIVNERH